MKKMNSLILVFCMLSMFSACGNSANEPGQSIGTETQTDSNKETQTGTQDDAQNEETQTGTQDDSQNGETEETPAVDGLASMVEKILGNSISLTDYELSYQDEEYANLYLIDGERIELDYTILLGDGTSITLPMVYSDLLNAGWTSRVQWEEKADAHSVGSTYHTNANGNTIFVTIKNPTDETMKVEDIWVSSITVGKDSTESFDIHGIKAGSTISDVVTAWGKPYQIEYSYSEEFDDTMKLNYEASYGDLTFYIDTETGLVSGALYHVTDQLINAAN